MADDPADAEVSLDPEAMLFVELTHEQRLRAWIFKNYCAGEPEQVDGQIFVTNLQSIFDWMKDGAVPKKARGALKVVEKA